MEEFGAGYWFKLNFPGRPSYTSLLSKKEDSHSSAPVPLFVNSVGGSATKSTTSAEQISDLRPNRRFARERVGCGTQTTSAKAGCPAGAASAEQVDRLATPLGAKPSRTSAVVLRPLPGEQTWICSGGIIWMYFNFMYGILQM